MLNNRENVDVIVPYSPEHTPKTFLDRAVTSISNQTVATNPIIVKDIEGKGPAWARNIGISRADSQYIAFCDADDYWKHEKLEKQLLEISNQNCAICLTQTKSKRTGEYNVKPFQSSEEFGEDILWMRSMSFTSSIIINTDKTSAEFNEDLYRREDHLFALQAAADGGICFVDEPLTIIHKHDQGLTSEKINLDKSWESEQEFYDLLTKSFPHLNSQKSTYWHWRHHNYGRRYYFEGDYPNSIKHLNNALSYQLDYRTLGALLISYFYSFISRSR